jgi:hypothetical protein
MSAYPKETDFTASADKGDRESFTEMEEKLYRNTFTAKEKKYRTKFLVPCIAPKTSGTRLREAYGTSGLLQRAVSTTTRGLNAKTFANRY